MRAIIQLVFFSALTCSHAAQCEETADNEPFERDKGTTFLTEWHVKHTLAGLPGKQTAGFVYGFDRKKLDFGTAPHYQRASL